MVALWAYTSCVKFNANLFFCDMENEGEIWKNCSTGMVMCYDIYDNGRLQEQ